MSMVSIAADYNGPLEAAHAHTDGDRYDLSGMWCCRLAHTGERGKGGLRTFTRNHPALKAKVSNVKFPIFKKFNAYRQILCRSA